MLNVLYQHSKNRFIKWECNYCSYFIKADRISTAVSDIGRTGGIVPPPVSVSSSVSQGASSGRMPLRPYHTPQQTIYPWVWLFFWIMMQIQKLKHLLELHVIINDQIIIKLPGIQWWHFWSLWIAKPFRFIRILRYAQHWLTI